MYELLFSVVGCKILVDDMLKFGVGLAVFVVSCVLGVVLGPVVTCGLIV